jgi:hypothetical protein
MPLKKTVGYGPIIEPMIEDKIMKLAINEKKTRKSKRKEKHSLHHRRHLTTPPPSMIRQQQSYACFFFSFSFFTINGNKFIFLNL